RPAPHWSAPAAAAPTRSRPGPRPRSTPATAPSRWPPSRPSPPRPGPPTCAPRPAPGAGGPDPRSPHPAAPTPAAAPPAPPTPPTGCPGRHPAAPILRTRARSARTPYRRWKWHVRRPGGGTVDPATGPDSRCGSVPEGRSWPVPGGERPPDRHGFAPVDHGDLHLTTDQGDRQRTHVCRQQPTGVRLRRRHRRDLRLPGLSAPGQEVGGLGGDTDRHLGELTHSVPGQSPVPG